MLLPHSSLNCSSLRSPSERRESTNPTFLTLSHGNGKPCDARLRGARDGQQIPRSANAFGAQTTRFARDDTVMTRGHVTRQQRDSSTAEHDALFERALWIVVFLRSE